MILKIQSLLIAIYLFFAGFIYGNAPKEIEFTCDIPSGVHEYVSGDKITVDVSAENVGRPFMWEPSTCRPALYVEIYTMVDGKAVYINDVNDFEYDLDVNYPEELVKHGEISKDTYTFIVSENAPKGDYIVYVHCFGEVEKFEGLITVK